MKNHLGGRVPMTCSLLLPVVLGWTPLWLSFLESGEPPPLLRAQKAHHPPHSKISHLV